MSLTFKKKLMLKISEIRQSIFKQITYSALVKESLSTVKINKKRWKQTTKTLKNSIVPVFLWWRAKVTTDVLLTEVNWRLAISIAKFFFFQFVADKIAILKSFINDNFRPELYFQNQKRKYQLWIATHTL